ncbi:hypothetical protein CO653_03090 [Rhizobium anhuiense]|nr:hypothetical protein CO665_03950 [Rhizobium anhuiense]PDS60682.1 hypothetical protein CO663_03165 [Rhizobium anhuiense]PDS67287.1 hypothetical protein CO653_03090 [Rhizobium anhuiense]
MAAILLICVYEGSGRLNAPPSRERAGRRRHSSGKAPLERRASFRTHKGRSNTFNPRIVLSENRFRFSGRCARRTEPPRYCAPRRFRRSRCW